MSQVEVKLAIWHGLFREMGDAEKRMTAAVSGRERLELQGEVQRLKEESDSALHEVHVALQTAKSAGAQQDTGRR